MPKSNKKKKKKVLKSNNPFDLMAAYRAAWDPKLGDQTIEYTTGLINRFWDAAPPSYVYLNRQVTVSPCKEHPGFYEAIFGGGKYGEIKTYARDPERAFGFALKEFAERVIKGEV